MKPVSSHASLLLLLLIFSLDLSSCKNKSPDRTITNSPIEKDSSNSLSPANIAPDKALTTGVQDAIRDYPGISASVNNGEIMLTGTIENDRLTKLIQSLQELGPKKINTDALIIK